MKLKYNFTLQQVLDEYYAVSTGEQSKKYDGVLRLNETGKRIFELIEEGKEQSDILSRLKEEYDASDDVLNSEINKIVDMLIKEAILEA